MFFNTRTSINMSHNSDAMTLKVLRNLAYGHTGRHKLKLLESGVIQCLCEARGTCNVGLPVD